MLCLALEYLSSLCLLPFPLFLPTFRSSFYVTLNTERLTIDSPVTTLPSPSVFYTASTGYNISTPHPADRGFKPSAQNRGHSAISTWPYPLGFISLLRTTNPMLHSPNTPNHVFTRNALWSSIYKFLYLFKNKQNSLNPKFHWSNIWAGIIELDPTMWECKLKNSKKKKINKQTNFFGCCNADIKTPYSFLLVSFLEVWQI